MAYSAVPTRTTADTNSSADINQLQDNITYIKSVDTPIALTALDTLATDTDVFSSTNGFTYTYYGSDLKITSIRMVAGTADTGATQPTIDVKIGGTSCLSAAKSLSAVDDTYVQATLSGTAANLIITSGDTITLDFTEGTNADAADLAVFIYCEVS